MNNQNSNPAAPSTSPSAANPNASTVIKEFTKQDFSNWKEESEYKYILNNVIVDYMRTVQVDMIGDAVAWNIANLKKPVEWNLPSQAIGADTKAKARIWIREFKSYMMAYFKKKWEAEYVTRFHKEEYKCLRNDDSSVVLNFKSICEMTRNINTREVRNKLSMFDLLLLF